MTENNLTVTITDKCVSIDMTNMPFTHRLRILLAILLFGKVNHIAKTKTTFIKD